MYNVKQPLTYNVSLTFRFIKYPQREIKKAFIKYEVKVFF